MVGEDKSTELCWPQGFVSYFYDDVYLQEVFLLENDLAISFIEVFCILGNCRLQGIQTRIDVMEDNHGGH